MHALAKILARCAGKKEVSTGEIVQVTPDAVMMHDRGVVRAIERFEEMGGKRVWDPDRCMVVFDHFYPPPRVQDAEGQKRARRFVEEQGIRNFYAGQGIAHIILTEKGHVFPGSLVVGTDSHTITNSGVGCFASGAGHSDVGSLLAVGKMWMRVPEVVRFDVHGDLPAGTSAKDIILLILQKYGEDACVYQGVEFAGPTVRKMGMDGRFTLCNLVVEFGGKTGYVQPDEITYQWVKGRCDDKMAMAQTTDSEKDYAAVYDLDVSKLQPMVATPHDLSHIVSVADAEGTRIDEAVLGTCTGGRLDDFRQAAAVLKGRKIPSHVRFVVNPGSLEVYRAAMKEGLIDILLDAGAVIGPPGCGPCNGCQLGMLGSGEVAISSSSRPFQGRMGSPESSIYVASAATVAASAAAGRIVRPAGEGKA